LNECSNESEHSQWRRDFLKKLGGGFGYLALSAIAAQNALADAGAATPANSLAPRPPHFPARAKRVIFLFMHGGPSQMDTFDPKPRLNELHGQPLPYKLDGFLAQRDGERKLKGSPFAFKQHGQSGAWVSEVFTHLTRHVDDLCFIKSLHTEGFAHGNATLMYHTGAASLVRPSMGAWISYGLGTECQNLPSFITITPPPAHGGVQNYGSAFLPAVHQGTPIGKPYEPFQPDVAHARNPRLTAVEQRRQLDFVQAINRRHAADAADAQQIEGVIQSLELAFRMQTEAPELIDLSGESEATKKLYGIGEKGTDDFGRQCLLARRFSEAGVRFVQVSDEYRWDHHGELDQKMPGTVARVDKPIAGLLHDLKTRGLLEETLVVWGGEFGRTAVAQAGKGKEDKTGRDHNPEAGVIWMAGGGVKPGVSYGATDEFGYFAQQDKVHIHDLHATILHLLGLDHGRLTYRHAGRDFRLTDIYGRVVEEVIA
jgi:hypothetical protein